MGDKVTQILPVLGRLPRYCKAAWVMWKDPQAPPRVRRLLAWAAGYAASPINLIPSLIPIVGELDDLWMVLWSLKRAVKSFPDGVGEAHLANCGLTLTQLEADLKITRRLLGRLLLPVVNGVTAVSGAIKGGARWVGGRTARGRRKEEPA